MLAEMGSDQNLLYLVHYRFLEIVYCWTASSIGIMGHDPWQTGTTVIIIFTLARHALVHLAFFVPCSGYQVA